MENNRRTKAIFKILASQLAVAGFIILLALSILFYAEGYRFNYKSLKVSKTGAIYVSSFPRDSIVTVDGKIKDKRTPFSENLIPGRYNITVTKDGYTKWSLTVKIEAGLVNNFKNVVLFKQNPEVKILTDQRIIDLLNSPIDTLAVKNSNGLSYSSYEIWVNKDLVTRFSKPVTGVSWYTADRQHIVFQQGNKIRIVELNGTNDVLLVNLDQTSPTNFIVNDKGDQLYYKDNGQYKAASIR